MQTILLSPTLILHLHQHSFQYQHRHWGFILNRIPGMYKFNRSFKAAVEEFFSPRLIPVLSISFLLVPLSLAVTGRTLGGPPLCFQPCGSCLPLWYVYICKYMYIYIYEYMYIYMLYCCVYMCIVNDVVYIYICIYMLFVYIVLCISALTIQLYTIQLYPTHTIHIYTIYTQSTHYIQSQ